MALPRLPPLRDIIADPSIVARLPTPLLLEVKNRLLSIEQSLSGSRNLPLTPIDLAISKPRWKWLDARHLHLLGQRVAEAIEHSEAGDSRALMVAMPPRHAKSTTLSVWTPFWYLARNPESPILLISYSDHKAREWGLRTRRLIEQFGSEYGLTLNPSKLSASDWELTTGGGMKTVGAGGAISGNPAKLLIVDDAVKSDEEARSDVLRENLWSWWDGTVIQRIEPDTVVIVIGTRYHEDDLMGRMLKHSESGTGVYFELLSLPALADDDDPLGRSAGEGLWLEHFPQDWYDKRRANVSAYSWSAVYQQRPSPPGGLKVDPDWWRFYLPAELPSSFDQEIQSWDLALDSVKKSDSRQAGLELARKGALVYVRDGFAEHCDINKVVNELQVWDRIYKSRYKLIERAISGNALVQMLRSKVRGMLAWPPKGQRKGGKEANLDACIPDIRSGNILLPLKPDGTRPRWVDDFIEELRQFPRGTHDDFVDAFTQGVNFLLPSARQSLSRDHDEALRHQPPKTPEEAHVSGLHTMMMKLAKPKLDALKRAGRKERRLSSLLAFPQKKRAGAGLLW